MSIDLNWETITSGPDGEELASRIRDFIHEKFQAVKLPRFIKSVTVHDFEFGSIPPQLELKDITDPLPDFYEDNDEYDDDDYEAEGEHEERDREGAGGYDNGGGGGAAGVGVGYGGGGGGTGMPGKRRQQEMQRMQAQSGGSHPPHVHGHHHHHNHHVHAHPGIPSRLQTGSPMRGAQAAASAGDMTSPFLGVSTPGILGGASNLHYFQSHLGTGWSGTQTPLAAVAGAQMGGSGNGNGNIGDYVGASSAASSPGLYPLHHPRHHHHGEIPPHTGGGYHSAGAGPSTPSSFHSRNPSQSSISVGDLSPALAALTPSNLPSQQQQQQQQQHIIQQPNNPTLREKSSVSTLAPTSVSTSRPSTRDPSNLAAAAAASGSAIDEGEGEGRHAGAGDDDENGDAQQRRRRPREPRPDDMQAVFRIRYAGDIKLRLTAEILLDYPMPSFVGIPVQLSVTGLTFDGVGVLAHIRKRVHFCFLSPEDALMAVGLSDGEEEEEGETQAQAQAQAQRETEDGVDDGEAEGRPRWQSAEGGDRGRRRFGGLLQEIRVESEIGLREGGKQSLKNVGKVERFVLEQVRRIFEDEFVYPSFWTFLV